MSEMAFSDQARRLARNFSWLTLQELLIRLIGLATAIYLARTLTAAAYGELGVALAVIGFAAVLVRAGTGSRATRLTARDPTAVPLIFAQVTGLRLASATVVLTVLVGFSGVIAPALSISPALLMLCSLLLLPPALTVAWAFRGLDDMQVTAVSDIAEKVLTLLALLWLVHGVGNDVLWAPVAEAAAGLLVIGWMYRRLARLYPGLRLQFRVRDWPEIAREAVPLSLATLLGSVYVNGGVLLLGWLASAGSAAMFLVAQKFMLTLAILLQVVNKAAFPAASRLVQVDVPAALGLATQLLRYYLVMIIPLFLLVAFHAGYLLALLFGETYAEAADVLIILLAALPFLVISNSLQLLLMALPRPAAVLAARIAGAAVLLALGVLLIPRSGTTGGAAGAALALAAGEAVSTVALFLFVIRATGGVPWDRRCFAPLLAGAAAALAYAAVQAWPIFFKLPLAAAIYLVLVVLLAGMTLREIRAVPLLLLSVARGEGSPQQRPQDAGVKPAAEDLSEHQP
jgi:O-antigen/teichoic acid export membrane protein